VREGQAVTFKVDAYPGETFAGSVRQIRLQATTTQNVVSYTTMIEVPNETLKLRPGMTATATIEIARRDGVPRVPNTALRFRPTTAMFAVLGQAKPGTARPGGAAAGTAAGPRAALAWAWANGRLEPLALTTGISDGTYTEIVAGTPSADRALVTTLTLPASAKASAAVDSPLMQQNGPPPGMPPGPPPGGPR
jgi:HlyD family secretion protein